MMHIISHIYELVPIIKNGHLLTKVWIETIAPVGLRAAFRMSPSYEGVD